jgi:prepilin peptidase CpaA
MALVLSLLLAFACLTDLRERRIRNVMVLAGLAVAVTGQLLPPLLAADGMGAVRALGHALAGAATGLAVFLPLYLLRAVGAGDVKLLAMVGAFLGAEATLQAGLYSAIAGGLLSLIFLCRPSVARRVGANLRAMASSVWGVLRGLPVQAGATPLQRSAVRIPYALAIAAGTWGQLWLAQRA